MKILSLLSAVFPAIAYLVGYWLGHRNGHEKGYYQSEIDALQNRITDHNQRSGVNQ